MTEVAQVQRERIHAGRISHKGGMRENMSHDKQELTPEEKLLALIQRDRREEAAPPVAVATPAPPVRPPAPAPVAVAPVVAELAPPAPKVEPLPEKKIKLSARAEQSPVGGTERSVTPSPEKVTPVRAVEVKPTPAAVQAESTPASAVETAPITMPTGVALPRPRVMTVRHGVGGLVLANRVMALVVLVLLVLVVYSVTSIQADVAKEVSGQVTSAGSSHLAPLAMAGEAVPALDYFLDKVSKRNLFVPIGGPAPTNAPPVVGKAGDLKLVGVSIDDALPEESLAIIRNKVDSKTYFVKTGESVGDTGLTLTRVLADRVILKSHKQEVELK